MFKKPIILATLLATLATSSLSAFIMNLNEA